MTQGYTRNDTTNNIAEGNIINASDLDGEFDAVQAAFNAITGHTHDGTVGGGAPIEVLGPSQNVVVSAAVVRPKDDNTIDLGTSALEFRNLYLDGTAQVDTLQVDESATVAANLTVNGNTTLGNADTDTLTLTAQVASSVVPSVDNTYDLGSITKEWKDLYVSGVANIDSLVADTADINGGTIDNATIATSNITVGAGKTLDVSAGTFTVANDQISGDKVEGGTINAITINNLTSTNANVTTVDATNLEVTNIKAKDGTSAGSIADTTGVVTLASSVLSTTDINGGTIDGTVIGETTPAAISGTTGTFSGDIIGTSAFARIRRPDTSGVMIVTSGTTSDNGAGIVAYGNTAALPNTLVVEGDSIILRDVAGTAPRFTVNSAGTIVGPSGYGGALSVSSAAVGGETTLVVSNSSTNQFARFGINGDVAQIAWDDGDALALGIANGSSAAGLTTEYMRILSNGNVGIGTNAPTAKLDVNGSVKVTGTISGTAVTQTATDTTASRLLKVGDFGVGVASDATSTYTVSDFNSSASGLARIAGTTTNGPSGVSSGTAIITANQSGRAGQIAHSTQNNLLYARSSHDSVFSSWSLLYGQNNILGTVSQSSGIPTGRVIERGSNANGEYVRFADGTQICTWQGNDTSGLTVTEGPFQISPADLTWTFPAVFISAPAVQISGARADKFGGAFLRGASTTTSQAFRLFATTALSVGVNIPHSRIATGRWF